MPRPSVRRLPANPTFRHPGGLLGSRLLTILFRAPPSLGKGRGRRECFPGAVHSDASTAVDSPGRDPSASGPEAASRGHREELHPGAVRGATLSKTFRPQPIPISSRMQHQTSRATDETASTRSLASLRALLLQARAPGDPVAASERRAFATAAGLELDRVRTHDLLEGPPSLADIRRHDVLMVGGSGDYYVSKRNLPAMDATLDRIRGVVELGHPTFASCFGFQLLVEALGGRVIHDPDRVEVGTYEVTLTEPGRSDPLFGDLPRRFQAQMGRKDRAEALPAGVIHLASSERCRYHALRIPDKPIWSTQFHPELDRRRNRSRFERYIDGYAPLMTDQERERALEGFLESPETDRLLSRFLRVVFG